MYKRSIRLIQIDLLSTCNAKCLHCYRQTVVSRKNIRYEKNVHVDPKAFNHLIEILNYIDEIKMNLSIIFHTNGSLGSKELWTQLASRLNGRGRFVKFAIDALADTNQIYRRAVPGIL